MKKKILSISILSIVIVTALIATGMFSVVTAETPIVKNDPANQPSRVVDEYTEKAIREEIKSEDLAVTTEAWNRLSSKECYIITEEDDTTDRCVKGATLASASLAEATNARIQELTNLCISYGYLDPETDINDYRDGYDNISKFYIACCEVYNDPGIELSAKEIILLKYYLNKGYVDLTGFDDAIQLTPIHTIAYRLIEETITPKRGLSPRVPHDTPLTTSQNN